MNQSSSRQPLPNLGVSGGGKRELRGALVALSLWLAVASAWAGCHLKQMEIPVRVVDQRPIANLVLNGTEVAMLLDSGAFFSMLSESTAALLKLPLRNLPPGIRIEGYAGRIAAKLTRIEKVGLLDAQLSNMEFLVGGNELGAGIMGVLGRNILSVADTEYDLAHGVVRLIFPEGECDNTNLAYWAGDAPVIQVPFDGSAHRADTAIRLEVRINGKRTLALLDTGAIRTSMTLKSARRAGIEEANLTPSGRVGGAGAGRVKSWLGRVAAFELGDERISNTSFWVDDTDRMDESMLIGLDYFLSHRIYVSRLQRQIYITWNGSPPFAGGRTTPGDYDARYAALPQDVSKEDADALARRGAAAMAAGNHQRALEDLNRACELAPGVAEYFHARARLHLAMRQAALALADLNKALELDPKLAQARLRRAWLNAGRRDGARAQADLVQLDAALPPSSALRADMAQLHVRLGQVADALGQYELWVKSHPRDARLAGVLNERCWLRTQLNLDLPLALEDCRQAVDLDEGAAAHRDSLGWTYLRLGDASKAKKAFDGALELEALPLSMFGRGLARLRSNDKAGGEQDLAAARKLEPKIDEVARKHGFEFAATEARPADAAQ